MMRSAMVFLLLFLFCTVSSFSCSPAEEPGGECLTQLDCGDGYTCEDGFCIEIPDDGNGDTDSDKDTVLPEGNETAVETEALPEAEGAPDELIDTMVDETPDQNDTVVEPDIDETADDTTDDLLDSMVEVDEIDDTDTVDTAIDKDLFDEDTIDIQPDLDVDVPDDDTAPTVTSTLPADNATGVAVTAKVEVHFSEALNTSSIGGNFTIMQGATNIPFSSMWRGVDNTVILTPNGVLTAGLVYEVTVKTGIADPAGNQLAAQYVFDFTTSACGNSVTDSGIGEVCDDGVNDGAYDGCMPGCMAHAPYCGDGLLTAGSEVCDTALSVACNALGQGYANSDIAVCSLGCQGIETDVCVCASGYEKNGGGACVDIKECDTANGGCAQNCIETEGSHSCSCNSGYTLNADGHACDDNDECIANPCDDNGDSGGACTNSTGSYDCSCSLNFEEKTGSCYDIDECTAGSDNCADTIATCTNTPGGFTCACNSYYAGDGTSCSFCNIDGQCGSGCTACGGGTTKCKDNGNGTSQCVQCIDNSQCNTGAGEVCNASNVCQNTCPSALTIATWNGSNEGWSFTGRWYVNAGTAAWGSGANPNEVYDHSLANGTNVDLSGCSNATLTFTISLRDDAGYSSESSTDKNNRLYIECSGDGGTNWASLSAPTLPSAQTSNSGCTTYYCDGNYGRDRSFSAVTQTWTLPAGCRTATARFRFRVNGQPWDLLNPGWTVDTVTVN